MAGPTIMGHNALLVRFIRRLAGNQSAEENTIRPHKRNENNNARYYYENGRLRHGGDIAKSSNRAARLKIKTRRSCVCSIIE